MKARTALVATLLGVCCAFGTACKREKPAPNDVLVAVESYARARATGDCKRAWDMLSTSAQLATDYEHFCRLLGGACSTATVEVGSGQAKGSGFSVYGATKCGGRSVEFGATLVSEKGVWVVEGFSEGFRD